MGPTGSAAARRYAKALFALAGEEGRVEAVQAELDRLVGQMATVPALGEVLLRPLYRTSERRAVLRRVGERLGLSSLLLNFCAFLIDQRRMRELPAIRESFAELADEAAGRARGELVAAAPLRKDQLERLRHALAARTGREVELSVRVDPELLGGAVARVGDLVFDGSLRTRLAQLRAQLGRAR